MKKEYFVAAAFIFFILSYILDYFAGPIAFSVSNPVAFFTKEYLNQFPLTAFAICIRALGLTISVALLISLVEKQYLIKAFSLFVVGMLSQLYAIQQLATGMRTTSIQWTLSISYGGLLLVFFVVYYLIVGVVLAVKEKLSLTNSLSDYK